MSARIGILKPGSTYADMIVRFGDYDAWFAQALGGHGLQFVVRAWRPAAPPPLDAADGWIVTGARSSVVGDDPEAAGLLDWIGRAIADEAPLLGVCYGHQALAAAAGGRVVRHPQGWELGTVDVELTEAGREDRLFAGLPDRFRVQATHEDAVEAPGEGATVLAGNAHTRVQALAVGPAARGVQFHPEVTPPIERDFVDRRRHLVPDPPAVEEAPEAVRVLENWVEGFVLGRRPAGRRA